MKEFHRIHSVLGSLSRAVFISLSAAILLTITAAVWAIITDLALVGEIHEPQAEHVDQFELVELVESGQTEEAFTQAFEEGDELFETVFNALDGVGANVGEGQRFTRVPRADLKGDGEWFNHVPERPTGPNGQACNHCHDTPFDDGAGPATADVHRDPFRTADLSMFIHRNTPHLFAPGAIQRLAEEMTAELHAIRDAAIAEACDTGETVMSPLAAKGVSYGKITVTCADVDTSEVEGINTDLIVRPFQWKGSDTFLRAFNRDASHREIGMQAVEIVGDGVDGDFDGVVDEMTVGDQTALAIYLAAQPRPTTRIELASLRLIPRLSRKEIRSIRNGKQVFRKAQCTSCHIPSLKIEDPIFSEPSQSPDYRDATFPAGQDPIARGVDPALPVTFDLTRDQPDNQIPRRFGRRVYRLGSLKKDRKGRAVVVLYGDLKRHDMGPGLAETIDEVGTGASVFLTENLWGVGSTAPYLHDSRATTLTEAILEHGGEAQASQLIFSGLALDEQRDLIAFLNNLVLFKIEEED